MDFIKKIYIYDLYIRNQDIFHRWLFVKKSKILGSTWTFITGIILAIVLAVTSFVMVHNRNEVDKIDYNRISRYAEAYAEEVPEYKKQLKFYMEDGKIIVMEYNSLQKLLTDYNKRKDHQDFLDAKHNLVKSIE